MEKFGKHQSWWKGGGGTIPGDLGAEAVGSRRKKQELHFMAAVSSPLIWASETSV